VSPEYPCSRRICHAGVSILGEVRIRVCIHCWRIATYWICFLKQVDLHPMPPDRFRHACGQNNPSVITLSPDPELAASSNPAILPGDTIMVATAGVVYVTETSTNRRISHD